EDAAIATTLPITNTGRTGNTVITRKPTAPAAAIREAAFDVAHPKDSTRETIHGVRTSPTLPLPATKAFASAPALNQRTAISNRKVFPAVSSTPLLIARQRSYKNVCSV